MRMLMLILILINSCQSQEKKEQMTNKINDTSKLISITCYLVSLDGTEEIYNIKQDSIYSFGEVKKLSAEQYYKFINAPKVVYSKDSKYGCGVCTDGVDFKFVFNYQDKKTVWEIEPGSKLSNEVSEYFNLLINKYKEIVIN